MFCLGLIIHTETLYCFLEICFCNLKRHGDLFASFKVKGIALSIFKKIMFLLMLGVLIAPAENVFAGKVTLGIQDSDDSDPRNGTGFMVDSWKGGFTRRHLRSLMHAVRDNVGSVDRSCDALDEAISHLCSAKKGPNVKLFRKKKAIAQELRGGSNRVTELRTKMQNAVKNYTAPELFKPVRRKAFPHALADGLWDLAWFNLTFVGLWLVSAIRTNFRRPEKMENEFKLYYKRLDRVTERAVRLHLELYDLLVCLSTEDQASIKQELDSVFVNKNNEKAMKEAQTKFLRGYSNGDKAHAVTILKIAKNIVDQPFSYITNLRNVVDMFMNKTFENSLPVAVK